MNHSYLHERQGSHCLVLPLKKKSKKANTDFVSPTHFRVWSMASFAFQQRIQEKEAVFICRLNIHSSHIQECTYFFFFWFKFLLRKLQCKMQHFPCFHSNYSGEAEIACIVYTGREKLAGNAWMKKTIQLSVTPQLSAQAENHTAYQFVF